MVQKLSIEGPAFVCESKCKGRPPGTGIFANRDLVRGPAGLPIGDLFGDRHVALRRVNLGSNRASPAFLSTAAHSSRLGVRYVVVWRRERPEPKRFSGWTMRDVSTYPQAYHHGA